MCEYVAEKASDSLPSGASAADALFTVSSGRVVVRRLFGMTTSGVTAAGNFELQVDVGSVNVVLGGGSFSLNGVPSGYMITANGGSYAGSGALDVVLKAGDVIQIAASGSATGSAAWTVVYQPLDPGAVLTAS